jgi:hypothetical protein
MGDRRKLHGKLFRIKQKKKKTNFLSGEIERCLKKVTEGVDTFDDIWQKVDKQNPISLIL